MVESTISDTVQQTTHGVIDTVVATVHATGGQGEGFNFMHLLHHIKNSNTLEVPFSHFELPQFAPIHVGSLVIDLSITKHVFFLLFGGVLLFVSCFWVARSYKKNIIPHGFVNLIELIIVFLRDEVVLPNMGHAGLKYMPYILTTFFYILVMNLAGLIPYGATATGNIMVTAGLAIIAFCMIQISAIKAQGLKHYLAHLTGGAPWFLWLIMVPIEILGLFTKPFALCMRLFANMTGGHIVILSLFGLIFMFRSFVVAPIPVLFVVGIYMLELFVAFLQAYVFTMLTSLFMGLGMQGENYEEEHHSLEK
jgi:F-type H+-transporting ATPase subunit a